MSTRGTFHFKGTDHRPSIWVYHHCDTYETGGAFLLYQAWAASRGGRITAEAFIRGNERAEITSDCHGDTEYHYEIEANQLTVSHRHPSTAEWSVVFSGPWLDFVNQNIDPEWVEGDFQPLKAIKLEWSATIYSPATLHAQLSDDLRMAGIWSSNGNSKGANWGGLMKRIKDAQSYLQSFSATPQWAKKAAA